MINRIFKNYLSNIGQKITIGELTITLPNNENLEFFGKGNLKSNLILNSYMPLIRTITSGHVGFAESYLKGEWTSSDLESLLEIMVTNLPEAFVGQPYLAQIDVLTPLDTSVSLSGLNVNVTIDNIELTSVTGLPNNFNYSCNPPSCIFPGGTYACAQLFSTSDPTSADIGYYPITMTTSTLAINIPLIGSLTQVDTVDYYYIDIYFLF